MSEEDQGYSKSSFATSKNDTLPRVLGQIWDNYDDNLNIEFSKMFVNASEEDITKRLVLSITAKLYDPLGIVAPVILLFKLLFQELCQKNFDWDEQLDESLKFKWKLLIQSLMKVRNISVKRCYCPISLYNDLKSVQLHAFGDASEVAYGSCVYLRCEHKSGEIHCSLVASKTRVSPASKQTIPRLELLACLVSARLACSVYKAFDGVLDIDKICYWSDSKVALSWIKGIDKEYKQKFGPLVTVGDVVTVHEDKISRLNWSMGVVEKLLTGADGNVRAAVVRVLDKSGKPKEVRRPLQKLYPVELSTNQKATDVPITFVEHAELENI